MRRLTKHLTPALAAVAVLGTAGVAAAAPNLVPVIDNNPDSTNPLATNKWYVETTATPYSAHYFYGATVSNTSATDALELKAKPGSTVGDTATAQQVIGATPTDLLPAKVAVKSIGEPNSGFTSWGVSNVFSIALTPPGGAAIPGGRNVFCWASASFVATCNTAGATADGVDMGISPGEVDSVAVGTDGAYFDITGATPGQGTVVETVNPAGGIDEGGAGGDNATSPLGIGIPGVTGSPIAKTTAFGTPVGIPLNANVVHPEVLGRRGTASPPAAATGAVTYALTSPPVHGTATVGGAAATYTPAAGYVGPDSFSYVATDSRGLQSTPIAVIVTVAAQNGGGGGGATPPVVTKITLKLKPGYVVQRRGGKTYLRIKGKLPKSQAGRIVIVQRKVGKKVRTLATIRIARNGVFTKLVRVSGRTITVRTRIAASSKAKAAVSPFKKVVIVRSRKR
jgi:hypothetical protein